MKHRQCKFSDLKIDRQEVYVGLGYGRNLTPEKEILSLVDSIYTEISSICKPQYMYEIYNAHTLSAATIAIEGLTFRTGGIITSYLSGMEQCCVFVTTAGWEYDTYKKQFRQSGDLPEEFIADAIGSVIAEACVTLIADELNATVDSICTYPYSPGYCNWKLTEQSLLFSLLPDKPCGVVLTESSLMMPIKSTSGIIGIGKNITQKAYSCNICENKNCYKRKEK